MNFAFKSDSIFVPNLGAASSYFNELVKADMKARLDRTDIIAASRLSLMQSIRVDLTRLDNAYQWRVPRVKAQLELITTKLPGFLIFDVFFLGF